MATTFFDTHDYVKRLEAAGVPPEQAEAHAKALGEAMTSELAKKSDLNDFQNSMKTQFAEVKGSLELVKWMLGFNLAFTLAVLWKLLR